MNNCIFCKVIKREVLGYIIEGNDEVVFEWEHKKLSSEVLKETQTKIKNAL